MSVVHDFQHGIFCVTCNVALTLVDKYIRSGCCKIFTMSCPVCELMINIEITKDFIKMMNDFDIEVN